MVRLVHILEKKHIAAVLQQPNMPIRIQGKKKRTIYQKTLKKLR